MRMIRWWGLGTAAIAILAAGPAAADVKAGVDAWQAGHYDAAVREWRPIADKGDADAQFNMGQAYKMGHGVAPDLRIAQSWYEKAAAQGHAKAQASLGIILFQNGERARALPWLGKAADRGDARAQYLLGTALFNGDQTAKDWPRAYALMSRAAAAGLPPAVSSLKEMDKYVPATQRQQGLALAAQIASGTARGSGRAIAAPAAPPKPAVTRVQAPKASPPAHASLPPPAAKAWRVQLGAYGSASAARGQWATLAKRLPALSGLKPNYEQAGKFTRLRVGPVASHAAAAKLCATAQAAGQACFPVAP